MEKSSQIKIKPKIISYEEYFSYRKKPFLYVKDLKHTLNLLGIDTKKKLKVDMVKELENIYYKIRSYEKHIDSINLIQKNFRQKRSFNENKYKGLAFYNRSICQNEEDFYTFENIKDIDDLYFFSYKDIDNFTWWFDIRTFKLLFDKNPSKTTNPYNRQDIPKVVVDRYLKRLKQMINKKINISFEEEKSLNEDQIYDLKVLEIFQKIDMLNVAAGGTNISWFKNLNLFQMKEYYKNLEDIWNYRAELSPTKQMEIVPNTQLFKIPVKTIYQFNDTDKRKLQNIILNEIDTLISSSPIDANKNLGCYYVLIAFTEVSNECANALPWLVNSY